MQILTRALDAFRRPPAPPPMLRPSGLELRQRSYVPTYSLNKPVWPEHNPAALDHEGYRKLTLVFRAVLVASNAVGTAPLHVWQETGPGSREQLPEHPLRRLLNKPNPAMGEARFLSYVAMLMHVCGFALLEKERSAAGRVVGLWPLRCDWARPIPRDGAAPDWEYRIPGSEHQKAGYAPNVIPAEDLVVVTYADTPDGRPTGIGPLEAALREVAIANALTEYLMSFLQRGGVPLLGLVPADDAEELSQEEADAFVEKFVLRYGGYQAAGRPAYLQAIKDVKRLGFDMDELAYPDLRDLTDASICTAFGVPPGMIGAQVGLERNTFTNFPESRAAFYEDTVDSLWKRIDDAFERSLLPDFETRPGYVLGFDTSGVKALQEDQTALFARVGAGVQQGWVTVNAALAAVGLPTVKGGDVFLRSMATIEEPAVPEGRSSQTPPEHAVEARTGPNGHGPGPEMPPSDPPLLAGVQPSGPLVDRERIRQAKALLTATNGNGNGHASAALLDPPASGRRLPPEIRARGARLARETVERLTEAGEPRLRRFWREQGERVAANPGRIDWDDEAKRLGLVLLGQYTASGVAAFAAASALTGVALSFDVANRNVQNVLELLGGRVVGISETTRSDVARIMGEAAVEGVGIDEAARRLTGLFEETYRNRATAVARTESMVGYAKASVLGYAESGVVTFAELADNPNHDTDPGPDGLTCAQRNGMVVPLDKVDRHIEAEHPNGTLAVLPVLAG